MTIPPIRECSSILATFKDTEMSYGFLVDTYETERIKVVSVWSDFTDGDLPVRPRFGDPRGRSVHEQMVHQCVSEDLWFRSMLGIDVNAPPLPQQETRMAFIKRYAEDSGKRLVALREKRDPWWRNTRPLRCAPLTSLGHDAPDHPHIASSRAADGHAAHARPRRAQ